MKTILLSSDIKEMRVKIIKKLKKEKKKRVKTYNLSFSNFFLLAIERGIKEMAITLKKEMTGD